MKKKKTNLSFKKEPRPTGLDAVCAGEPDTIIKINKNKCGQINAPSWRTKDNLWSISLAVKTDYQENCEWKLIYLKVRFKTESEARDFIKEYWDTILNKYEIHSFED